MISHPHLGAVLHEIRESPSEPWKLWSDLIVPWAGIGFGGQTLGSVLLSWLSWQFLHSTEEI